MSQVTQGAFSALSAEERNEIVIAHMPMVYHIVARLEKDGVVKLGVDPADLIQEGAVALVTSIERYRDGYGASFRTFAYWRVSGRIIDFIRAQNPAPRSANARRKEFLAVDQRYEHTYGRKATIAEMCRELNITRRQYDRARASIMAMEPMISLDVPYPGAKNGADLAENAFSNYMASDDRSTEDLVVSDNDRVHIQAAIAKLPPRIRFAITGRFYDNLRQIDIAKHLQVDPTTIHKYTKRALRILRETPSLGRGHTNHAA